MATGLTPAQAWAVAFKFIELYRKDTPGVTREQVERAIDMWYAMCEGVVHYAERHRRVKFSRR